MTAYESTWLLITDAGVSRLFHCQVTELGTPHLTEHESFHYTSTDHQHGRPSARTGESGHTYASEGHEADEELRRAAQGTTTWAQERVDQHHIDRLCVFAPARFMGALREHWPTKLTDRVREFEADLTHLDVGKLADHPKIREIASSNMPTMM